MVTKAKEILEKFYERYQCLSIPHTITGGVGETEEEFRYVVNWENGKGSLFLCGTASIPDAPVNWRFQILDLESNAVASHGPIVYDGTVGDFLPIKSYFFKAGLAK